MLRTNCAALCVPLRGVYLLRFSAKFKKLENPNWKKIKCILEATSQLTLLLSSDENILSPNDVEKPAQ